LPGRPHALTFLFGTTLIGLGVDYCFHALHGCRVRDLTRALVTTVFAFSPLLFSSVSVLRQMAVFTSAGLVTIFSCALLFRGDRPHSPVGTDPNWVGTDPRFRGDRPHGKSAYLVKKIVILLILALSAFGLVRLSFGNDPASFYRPDPFLAENEAAVAEALGTADARFELVDLEAWQRENAALKAKMGPVPGEFLTAADLPPDLTVSIKGRDYLLLPSEKGLSLRDELEKTFAALAAETYRLLAVSFAVLVVVLAALFRGRFAAHVLPIGAAILATAGVLGWLGRPVNFFQVLSFFILSGLGIDYVIFHQAESGGGAPARRVVLFSFLTSLVGFGLLAFTSFPVTRGMGVTLAAGLAFSYVASLKDSRR
jgi:predicted exporter